MLEREMALYRALQNEGFKISFITYGQIDESTYLNEDEGIEVAYNKWGLSEGAYAKMIPILHWKLLAAADLIKSNQLDGAEAAMRSASIFRKPKIARGGYLWSDFIRKKWGEGSERLKQVLSIERKIFDVADKVILSTQSMKHEILEQVPRWEAKTEVIPNYVDTDRFAPQNEEAVRDLVFIGRVVEQKNLKLLLSALSNTQMTLAVIGDGDLKESLQEEFADLNDQVEWLGHMPSEQLRSEICRSRIFVLPSLYEGLPKVLLEAMACGVCVVGTNVDGIREVIQSGSTGELVEPSEDALRQCLLGLLQDSEKAKQLGCNAREEILTNYSLTRVTQREADLHRSILTAQ